MSKVRSGGSVSGRPAIWRQDVLSSSRTPVSERFFRPDWALCRSARCLKRQPRSEPSKRTTRSTRKQRATLPRRISIRAVSSVCCWSRRSIEKQRGRAMSVTVCIVANTLRYPKGGGHMWVYLNWALGLREIGCDVVWLEGLFENVAERPSQAVEALKRRLAPYALDHRVAVWCNETV